MALIFCAFKIVEDKELTQPTAQQQKAITDQIFNIAQEAGKKIAANYGGKTEAEYTMALNEMKNKDDLKGLINLLNTYGLNKEVEEINIDTLGAIKQKALGELDQKHARNEITDDQWKQGRKEIDAAKNLNELLEIARRWNLENSIRLIEKAIEQQKKSAPKGGGPQKTQVAQTEDRKRDETRRTQTQKAKGKIPKTTTPGEEQAEERRKHYAEEPHSPNTEFFKPVA